MDGKTVNQGRATKEFQDFFTSQKTSEELSKIIINHLRRLYNDVKRPVKIMEPAVGTGSLIWPLLASDVPMVILCGDIQIDYLAYVEEKAKSLGYTVQSGKFGGVVVQNY